jgi:tetratricopeptide (TPR) repeat protein
MSHNRLTRQDIKRDEVMEGLSSVAGFVRGNARALALGLAVAFATLATVVIWQTVAAGREVKANDLLGAALKVAQAEDGGLEAAADQFAKVAETYGSTRAGSIAHAYLGTLAAQKEDFDAAREHWSKALEHHSDDALAAGVERDLIALDRAQGHDEELAQRLRDTLAGGQSALGADTVLYELATTLERLGQVEGAREAYTRLLDEHPTSVFAQQARERTAALDAS